MKLAQPGSAELELLRNRAEAEIHLRKRGGDWSAGLTAHTKYQNRPEDWIVERLGVPRETLRWSLNPEYATYEWDGTKDPLCVALEALADWKSAGIESGTGIGKTFTAACVVFWFLACFEDSIVSTVAPKEDQLLKHVWKEIGKLWPRFEHWFPTAELLTGLIRMKPQVSGKEVWAASVFVCGVGATEETASKARGLHAEHMLIITEETPGIDRAIMKALASTRTDDHNLHLGLGNPESRIDQLHLMCFNDREQPRRNVVHVRASALDHPNIVTGRRVVPGAIGRERLADRTEELVEGSRFYKADVQGICPDEAEDALISMAWCVAAAKRWADPLLREGPPALGVDVADTTTGDEAAIADWEGACCLEVTSWHIKEDAEEVAEEVYRRATDPDRPIDPKHIGLDNVGVGASAYNRLARLGLRVRKMSTITRVIPMMLPAPPEPEDEEEGAEATKLRAVVESERYDHPRSQIWWRFREDLRLGYIALPDDPDLFRQLCVPTYTKKAGRICVQSKEEIVKLLGRSPDKGDACVYGNFVRPRRRRKPAPQEEKIDSRNVDRGLERRLARHQKRINKEEVMIKRLLKKSRSRSER